MARHPKQRPTMFEALTRRDFLMKGAATAVSIPMASALLAACGKNTSGGDGGSPPPEKLPQARPDNPVKLPLSDGNAAIASDLPIETDATLKLYNWDQYINKKVLDDFAAKYNCKYEISTFNNMDEALAKIRSSQVEFDVFFPTIDTLSKLAYFQLVQPLNHDYLPNLQANVWPEFTKPDQPFYDQGQLYTIPYTVYTTGIGWRNDLVDEKDDPWHIDNPYDIFWNAKYKGKIGIYDDIREAMSMALLRNGVDDVNTCDAASLSKAKDVLMELSDKVNVALDINGTYEDLPKGIFDVHQAWSGDMTSAPYYGKENAAATGPLLSYWWPKDAKGIIGNDCMAILKNATSPVLAHTFLNYMVDEDAALKNFSWTGYQPPQIAAPPEAFNDPKFKWNWVVYPNLINTIAQPEDFDRGFMELELDPQCDALWHDNWEEFTSGV